ncbi:ACT domain-containing protein [Clostridioides difficile]
MFNENGIMIKLITTSEIRITCAINSDDKQVAIEKIAEVFNI